jgi:hypothetical protein
VADVPTLLIGLGATKAGTSWLYDQLSVQPGCHFRTLKELHYFNAVESGRWGAALRSVEQRILRYQRLMAQAPMRNNDYRLRHLGDLQDWLAVLQRRRADLDAYRAYLTDGAPPGTHLCGDITPAYALLSADRLRQMAVLTPDVRFVYLLREPVARLWSHVRMIAARQAPEAERGAAALAMMQRLVTAPAGDDPDGILARGDYRAALMRMAGAIAPDRLLVMFQEDLMTPAGLARLADYLGIAPIRADTEHKVHEGFSLRLPPELAAAARWMLRPQYDFIAAQRGPVPEAWRIAFDEGQP